MPDQVSGSSNNSMEGMLDAQKAQSERLFALQVRQSMQTEESAAKTNMEKSRHDAMMAVITNFKA